MDTIKNINANHGDDRENPQQASGGHSRKYYTGHQVYLENKIYWIKSYKAVLKYMRKYEHILKPIKTGGGSGIRYRVSEENLKNFIWMFENNKLC
ncbi:MAG: hypothetical protein AAB446_02045 [Patescibacteria group bacterium]